MTRRIAVSVGVVVVALSGGAWAARPDRPRRTAVYTIFGVGTPVGGIGLEVVHRFGSAFELAAGIGEGTSASESQTAHSIGRVLQWSLMPRIHLGNSEGNAFTLGLGVSGGQYGGFDLFGFGPGCEIDGGPCGPYPTRYVLWGNFEIGGEHWVHGGFAIRYFFGYARGTTLSPMSGSVNSNTLSMPYTGIGVGYAF